MTKLLQEAIDTVKALPEEEQDLIATEMLAMARHVQNRDGRSDVGRRDIGLSGRSLLDEETRAAILEGLGQADRGEFASDEDMAVLFGRQSR